MIIIMQQTVKLLESKNRLNDLNSYEAPELKGKYFKTKLKENNEKGN